MITELKSCPRHLEENAHERHARNSFEKRDYGAMNGSVVTTRLGPPA